MLACLLIAAGTPTFLHACNLHIPYSSEVADRTPSRLRALDPSLPPKHLGVCLPTTHLHHHATMAEKILMNEFKALSRETWTHISLVDDSNIFAWNIALIPLNPDSLYYGGYFRARMTFTTNYPYSPPDFRFERPLWHPNVYPDGRLCISILHAPGEDVMSGEEAGERWSPVQRVESVLISVLSLLDDAEVSSPANVDAGVMLRTDPEGYKRKVRAEKERSLRDIPEGFVMPTHESAFAQAKRDADAKASEEQFSWSDSDAEDDFGESGSDEEMFDDGDEGDEDSEEVEGEEEEEDATK